MCRKLYSNLQQHMVLGHFKADVTKDYDKLLLSSGKRTLTDRGEKECCVCSLKLKSTKSVLIHVGVKHEMVYRFVPAEARNLLVSMRKYASAQTIGEVFCPMCDKAIKDLQALRLHWLLHVWEARHYY